MLGEYLTRNELHPSLIAPEIILDNSKKYSSWRVLSYSNRYYSSLLVGQYNWEGQKEIVQLIQGQPRQQIPK
jgi:hypothetical protein